MGDGVLHAQVPIGSMVTWACPTGIGGHMSGAGHGVLERWQTDATGRRWALVAPGGMQSTMPPIWVRSGDLLELHRLP